MQHSYPIIEAREKISFLADKLQKDPAQGAISITRRGKPVLAMLNWDLYESIIETLEIMGDEETMKSLKKSFKEIEEGRLIPWEKVKKDLKL